MSILSNYNLPLFKKESKGTKFHNFKMNLNKLLKREA